VLVRKTLDGSVTSPEIPSAPVPSLKNSNDSVANHVEWETRPLIEPRRDLDFECCQTFNAGAVVIGDKVHFLYRAIGRDSISRFGYANSRDGLHLDERLDKPAFQYNLVRPSSYSHASGGSSGGIEDPRIVRIEDKVHMTYTVCDENGLGVGITAISVDDFLALKWDHARVRTISPLAEIHKNWVLFPEKIGGRYALMHSISPKILIDYSDDLMFEGEDLVRSYHNGVLNGGWKGAWEGWIRGVGPPPIRTDYGWLVFYHALPRNHLGGYCIGAMLLDIDDPTTILYRAKEPIVTPRDIAAGVKPNVVYACGAVIKDGNVFLYYGAADTRVHVAHTNLNAFLNVLARRG
jgi:predicted GH43/DUF377 family glycosyl hydrolase